MRSDLRLLVAAAACAGSLSLSPIARAAGPIGAPPPSSVASAPTRVRGFDLALGGRRISLHVGGSVDPVTHQSVHFRSFSISGKADALSPTGERGHEYHWSSTQTIAADGSHHDTRAVGFSAVGGKGGHAASVESEHHVTPPNAADGRSSTFSQRFVDVASQKLQKSGDVVTHDYHSEKWSQARFSAAGALASTDTGGRRHVAIEREDARTGDTKALIYNSNHGERTTPAAAFVERRNGRELAFTRITAATKDRTSSGFFTYGVRGSENGGDFATSRVHLGTVHVDGRTGAERATGLIAEKSVSPPVQ